MCLIGTELFHFRGFKLITLINICLFSLFAHAEVSPPNDSDSVQQALSRNFIACRDVVPPLTAPKEKWELALQQKDRCQQDTDYLVSVSRWLNIEKRYDQSLLFSERALLLDSDNPQAWVEFGLSQAALGYGKPSVEALGRARELAATQINQVNPVQGVKDELSRLVLEIDQLMKVGTQLPSPHMIRMYQTFGGYDDNFYGGPEIDSFELTLPNGNLSMNLPNSLKVQGGGFVGGVISQEGVIDGRQAWRYGVQGRVKVLLNSGGKSIASIQANTHYLNKEVSNYFFSSRFAVMSLDSEVVSSQLHMGVGREIDGLNFCQVRNSLEYEVLHYPQDSNIDGRYFGLMNEGVCLGEWAWQVRVGKDSPRRPGSRAGNAQDQIAMQTSKTWRINNHKAMVGQFGLWLQRDESGYSPLLAQNSRRRVNKIALRVEYQWNTQNTYQPYLGIDQSYQHSNLDLFKSRNTVIQLGVRGKW